MCFNVFLRVAHLSSVGFSDVVENCNIKNDIAVLKNVLDLSQSHCQP